MTPLPERAGIVHDRNHFLTPADRYTEGDLIDAGVRVQQVRDLSERYEIEAGFTPDEVEVDLWRLTDDEADVLEAISALRGADFDARPVYCFGFEGHWSLEPGSEAAHRQGMPSGGGKVTTNAPDPAAIEGANLKAGAPGGALVAVVDAGFSAVLPRPISGSADGEIEDESAKEVHGSFVLHLIELSAPGARIDYIGVPQLKPEQIRTSMARHWPRSPRDPAEPKVICSDDLAVAMAMRRVAILMLGASDGGRRFLNLSLGTYLPESGIVSHLPGLAPMATDRALDIASENGVRVIAAAGNDLREASSSFGDGPAFYPACREDVFAIGAANLAGDPVMWRHGSRVPRARWWWTATAPGIDLVGAPYDTTGTEKQALRWSGSSFAAAVATGRLASGQPFGNTSYSDVPDLSYLKPGEVFTNP